MIVVVLCCLLFIAMIIYPFWPGYKELKKGDDNDNLYIKKDYVKDPRYFGRSFRNLLDPFLTQIKKSNIRETVEIVLSKKEFITLGKIEDGKMFIEDRLIVFSENSVLPAGSRCMKEVYALQNINVREKCKLRAVACNESCYVDKDTEVIRWIDAKGILTISDNCNLGISASSTTKLAIKGKNCIFKRLFAPVIEIGFFEKYNSSIIDFEYNVYPVYRDVVYELEKIEEQSIITNNIVTHKKLILCRNSIVVGSIKSYKNMCLKTKSRIFGNVFCEGDLVIQDECLITGTVFVQGNLSVGNGVILGEKGKIKSVIVRKNISLGNGVLIHGFVLTEGVGKIV